jgi:excisionase family DNA binding protein
MVGATHTPADDLLTIAEVARRCAVNRGTVRRWISAGKLPACRLGDGPSTHIRVTRFDLEAFVVPTPATRAGNGAMRSRTLH